MCQTALAFALIVALAVPAEAQHFRRPVLSFTRDELSTPLYCRKSWSIPVPFRPGSRRADTTHWKAAGEWRLPSPLRSPRDAGPIGALPSRPMAVRFGSASPHRDRPHGPNIGRKLTGRPRPSRDVGVDRSDGSGWPMPDGFGGPAPPAGAGHRAVAASGQPARPVGHTPSGSVRSRCSTCHAVPSILWGTGWGIPALGAL